MSPSCTQYYSEGLSLVVNVLYNYYNFINPPLYGLGLLNYVIYKDRPILVNYTLYIALCLLSCTNKEVLYIYLEMYFCLSLFILYKGKKKMLIQYLLINALFSWVYLLSLSHPTLLNLYFYFKVGVFPFNYWYRYFYLSLTKNTLLFISTLQKYIFIVLFSNLNLRVPFTLALLGGITSFIVTLKTRTLLVSLTIFNACFFLYLGEGFLEYFIIYTLHIILFFHTFGGWSISYIIF